MPLIVLGAAVEWPAGLSDPASIALPRLADNEGAARVGYAVYLLYSVLFAVTITMLARLVEGDLVPGVRQLVIGFAVASAVARSIGIVRWLGPMPELATSYSAATDVGQRYAIARVYDALNSYGGTIGEVLGVGLFGVDLGPVLTVTVTVVQLWFLATGAWLVARGARRLSAG